ncbi:MAG: phage major capsid protein, partial [Rhodobacteraceae bacterium]
MTSPVPQAAGPTGAGAPEGPELELKTAMQGLARDFADFQTDLTRKLSQTEERLTMLDRKTAPSPARPMLASADAGEMLHHKAFDAYLRRGDEAPMRGLEIETKGLNTMQPVDGGYLVDPETAASIQSVLSATASIRAIASVVTVEASSFDVLVDHSDVSTGWATESDPVAESDTPKIDRIPITLHELSAMPKASQR